MKKETAEQKLLKLIENSEKPKAGQAAPAKAEAPVRQPVTKEQSVAKQMADSVKGLGAPGFSAGPLFKGLSGISMSFGLKDVNRLLLFAIVFVFAFLVSDVMVGLRSLDQKINITLDAKITKNPSGFLPPVKDVSAYLSSVEARNIFQPFEKKAGGEAAYAPGTRKISGKVEKLKLVGISWLDSPESASAMIEDADSGTTYFLKQGEKVKDVTVKNIYADRVILSFEEEEMAIKL